MYKYGHIYRERERDGEGVCLYLYILIYNYLCVCVCLSVVSALSFPSGCNPGKKKKQQGLPSAPCAGCCLTGLVGALHVSERVLSVEQCKP